MRYSRLKAHLNAAQGYADLSYAERLKVSALIVKHDRPICSGRNGMPPGGDNKCEDENGNTRPEVSHAESNAISYAARHGLATDGATLISTHSPCFECAKMILSAGIVEVYYKEEYRLTESLDFLRSYNIKVERIKDES